MNCKNRILTYKFNIKNKLFFVGTHNDILNSVIQY